MFIILSFCVFFFPVDIAYSFPYTNDLIIIFFPLQADLCGIKWRKLVLGERPNATGDPLDDPVLSSYSRCLAVDILCVWRRVAAPKQEPDSSANLFGDLNVTLPGGSGSVTHPPLSLTAAKELWIFWYGEEPDLTDLVAPELQKSSGKLIYKKVIVQT